ncbi:MAG: substrate-binding domain-containing protein [Aerococcus sp.]|nr:substrate-binding domain-containing protein [Aerococcus sp.]
MDVSKYTTPSLSTIHLATRQMGETGVWLLQELIAGHLTTPIKITTASQLIFRESTKKQNQ